MSRALKCGCEIESDYSYKEGRTVDCSTIIFCELHEAAPALLEALSKLLPHASVCREAAIALQKASSVPIGTPKVKANKVPLSVAAARAGLIPSQETDDLTPKLYIGVYHHRHGEDYAIFEHEPTQDEMETCWEFAYEPEREDEWFESSGPHKVNS